MPGKLIKENKTLEDGYSQSEIDTMFANEPDVYYGTGVPLDTLGKNGDIYIQLEE